MRWVRCWQFIFNSVFTLHFLLPFLIAAIRGLHLFFLHLRGSNNPLGLGQNSDKLKFNPYFTWKDILGVLFVFQVLLVLVTFRPWLLGDPENFIQANPYITPIHIQPEWYFLFAYAILRRIPNKLGGVVALVLSVAIFYTLPLINSSIGKSKIFIPLNKLFFWGLVNVIILLTWIGARPVENPYILTGQILTAVYFMWFIINRVSISLWHKRIFYLIIKLYITSNYKIFGDKISKWGWTFQVLSLSYGWV